MSRRLFILFTMFSGLLFLANGGIWLRSYFVGDRFERTAEKYMPPAVELTEQNLSWSSGLVNFYSHVVLHVYSASELERIARDNQSTPDHAEWSRAALTPEWNTLKDTVLHRMGFINIYSSAILSGPVPATSTSRILSVPCWFVGLITSILPAVSFTNRVRNKTRTGFPVEVL